MNKITMSIAGLVGVTALSFVSVGSALAASYTTTQVAAHSTSADCWEIINGKVYNLTAFISVHSGGQAVIIGQCGKDATATFNSGPHSSSTINALNPYLLGDLTAAVVTPVPTTPPPAVTSVITKTSHEADEKSEVGERGHKIRASSVGKNKTHLAHSQNKSTERNDD